LNYIQLSFWSHQQGMVPSKKNNVTCPKCKRVYQLPDGGAVTDLPTNNFALCILQLLKDRRSWWFIHSNHFIISSSISNNLNTDFSVSGVWLVTLCLSQAATIPTTLSWTGARTWMNCTPCFWLVPHFRVTSWLCGSDTNRTSNWNLKDCRKRWRQSSCWCQRTAVAWRKGDWWCRIGLQSRASPNYWPTALFRSRRA